MSLLQEDMNIGEVAVSGEVYSSLKAAQTDRFVKKPYGMLTFISRGIEYTSQEVTLQIY